MQSGFRAGHGCTSASRSLNYIITAIDKRHYCAAVFIDLPKAFHSVNHHILIGRLNSLGFSKDCIAWFTNYLSDRVQCVKSEGLLSGPLPVSMGMPQGSILEPTLFSVYINYVALEAGDSLIHLYADVTILYTSGPSLDTVLANLSFLFRNKASFTRAAKHTLVKLTILPILDYGDVIYKIASNTLLIKLDVVYHSAIRFVTKAPYTTHQ